MYMVTYKKTRLCNACRGTGVVHPVKYTKEALTLVKKLRKTGLSMRAICKEVGAKNPQTIKRMLETV